MTQLDIARGTRSAAYCKSLMKQYGEYLILRILDDEKFANISFRQSVRCGKVLPSYPVIETQV